jgi:fumarate hydratase class II
MRLLADKAIANMTINAESMATLVEKNPILVTTLGPLIGYDRAAQIAKGLRRRKIRARGSSGNDRPQHCRAGTTAQSALDDQWGIGG